MEYIGLGIVILAGLFLSYMLGYYTGLHHCYDILKEGVDRAREEQKNDNE